MTDTIYAVMVNWNLKFDTIACVKSLLAARPVKGQVVVVDNGSTDGSAQILQEEFGGWIHIIKSDVNHGYAGCVNLGARFALEQGAEWVLLLNNDTLVAPSLFVNFGQVLNRTQAFSVLAPLIFYHNDPERIWYCGDRLIPGTLITLSLYKNRHASANLPSVVQVDFVSGCGMLVRRSVFETIGFFDPTLFMYGEEVDFCWRARLAGFRLACVTSARMWHKVSASANRDKPYARYLRVRNQILFYRAYARGFQRPVMVLFAGFRLMAIFLRDVWAGEWALIKPLVMGWWHGWLGRTGAT
jgi:hypothetical protein